MESSTMKKPASRAKYLEKPRINSSSVKLCPRTVTDLTGGEGCDGGDADEGEATTGAGTGGAAVFPREEKSRNSVSWFMRCSRYRFWN